MTAVQMLIEYIKRQGFDLEYEMEMSFLDHEKEQILDAYKRGWDIGNFGSDCWEEIYYNETYKK